MTVDGGSPPRPLLLRGGLVLAPSPRDGFRPADLLLLGERIAAVGPDLCAPAEAEIGDLGGRLVMPGLVNAHAHSPYLLNVGLADESPLELWSLANGPGRAADPETLGLCARLHAAELLRGGVTGVIDMVRLEGGTAAEGLDAIAEAYLESGMRAAVAPVLADLPLADTLPLDVPSSHSANCASVDWDDRLRLVEGLHRGWHGRAGRIAVQVGPSGPQRCSDGLYAAAVELARRLETRVHTHALETAPQRDQALRRWGRPMLEHLAANDLLGSETTLAHLAWPTPRGVELVAERGAVAVHNPASNCVLGSGRMPLPELLAAGATVALGTDAPSCNDGLSMFEAMKWGAILHRPFTPDWRDWPHPTDLLRAATVGGGAALGRDDLGTIEPGQLADLVILGADDPSLTPPRDLAREVVMRGHAGLVRDVIVGGRQVVRDGHLLTLDLPSLVARGHALATAPLVEPPTAALRPAIERMLAAVRGGARRPRCG